MSSIHASLIFVLRAPKIKYWWRNRNHVRREVERPGELAAKVALLAPLTPESPYTLVCSAVPGCNGGWLSDATAELTPFRCRLSRRGSKASQGLTYPATGRITTPGADVNLSPNPPRVLSTTPELCFEPEIVLRLVAMRGSFLSLFIYPSRFLSLSLVLALSEHYPGRSARICYVMILVTMDCNGRSEGRDGRV